MDECGFNAYLGNAPRILKKIIKDKNLRPLLVGLDNDLDEMLDTAMRPKRKE